MKQRQYLIYFSIALIGLFLIVSCQVLQPDLKTSSPASTLRLGFNNRPDVPFGKLLTSKKFSRKTIWMLTYNFLIIPLD